MKGKLSAGHLVGCFCVERFLKVSQGSLVESYLVKNGRGRNGLMKICETGNPTAALEYETIALMEGSYPLLPIIAAGKECANGIEYKYIVREFVEGERLSDILSGGKCFTLEEALPIFLQILVALKHLHSQSPAIIHNDITPRNIIVSEVNGRNRVYVIGTGHVSHSVNGKPPFCTKDLNSFYRAPETFKGIYDEQTDIFAAGVLFYTMLTGTEPWSDVQTGEKIKAGKEMISAMKSAGYGFIDQMPCDENFKIMVRKMIDLDYGKRYKSIDTVIASLSMIATESQRENVEEYLMDQENEFKKHTGGGFAEVAGMEEVKQMLQTDVLFILKNREKAEKYRLKLPNGALFYGPPGCGKTFIAEKFAEESQLNFIMVKASDLGSIYIHGTQGKIAELFNRAEENAPTVLCFDELDGMVPDRSGVQSEGASGEVNEFLSQLNNCAERGIFVIGTSNRPDKIDPAVLRTGRIDKIVYVPVPDPQARRELFRIHLEGRYCNEDINLDELAAISEGYVASDISFIVNQSALKAAMADVPISQDLIVAETVKARRSVSPDLALKYERMKMSFEQHTAEKHRSRIGFKTN